MLLFMFYVIVIQLQDVIGFLCICSGNMGSYCEEGCEAGSYCKTTWIVAGGAVRDTTCVTTRTDLTDQKCQTNRKGLVSCICNTEKCNDASFSIPSDAVLTVPPTIKCYNTDLNEDNFCFGHYCTYSAQVVYNDDLNSVNVCTLMDDSISCKCNTEFCNKNQPFQVPLGKVLCYIGPSSSIPRPPALKYCRGHLCFQGAVDYDGRIPRGCLSVSDNAPEALKKPGKYLMYKFCDQDLCNGDYTADLVTVEGSGTTAAPN
ncbi:hypothetical protein CAEBREN_09457 [Caenorhabditis brenneri]|uniref:DUF7622 domain-containing protein n=1 Tax=Caenorhabditis brenneri TaxID=135651 RepID=G0MTC0_CAEBE|nr:hypothetical protein CAEBREN_09457 [Caenorhabditis brenneri]